MDFSNRGTQPQNVTPSGHAPAATSASVGGKKNQDKSKWSRILLVVFAAIVSLALIGLLLVAILSGKGYNESKYVDSNRLQAVFLNTGQVYFGNVKVLNSSFFVLTNIYYLQTASTSGSASSANSSVSLVKLGCELHEPYDQMVINRTQVTFWENLQEGGQVSKAVSAFEKANPNGQKCVDQSTSSPTTSNNSVQNAGSSNTTGGTTTTKP